MVTIKTILAATSGGSASAGGVEASTCGANPGRTVSEAATTAATAIAERALNMRRSPVIPVFGPFGPSLVNHDVTAGGFAMPSPAGKMVSSASGFVSSTSGGRNKAGIFDREDAGTGQAVHPDAQN